MINSREWTTLFKTTVQIQQKQFWIKRGGFLCQASFTWKQEKLSKQPPQNNPSRHPGGWVKLWSAEEMLDEQHQRVNIPARARTAYGGLLQKTDWKRISAESSLVSPQQPNWSRDWTELNMETCRETFQKKRVFKEWWFLIGGSNVPSLQPFHIMPLAMECYVYWPASLCQTYILADSHLSEYTRVSRHLRDNQFNHVKVSTAFVAGYFSCTVQDWWVLLISVYTQAISWCCSISTDSVTCFFCFVFVFNSHVHNAFCCGK